MPKPSKRYHVEKGTRERHLVLDIMTKQAKSGDCWDCILFKNRTAMFFNFTTGLNIWHRASIKRITGWMPVKQRHKNKPLKFTFASEPYGGGGMEPKR